jgi:hypothetical protein
MRHDLVYGSWILTSLPNSFGLLALPLRMTSVSGSKNADDLAFRPRIAAQHPSPRFAA